MSAYDDAADQFCEHVAETCDDPYCQVCYEEAERKEEMYEACRGSEICR